MVPVETQMAFMEREILRKFQSREFIIEEVLVHSNKEILFLYNNRFTDFWIRIVLFIGNLAAPLVLLCHSRKAGLDFDF